MSQTRIDPRFTGMRPAELQAPSAHQPLQFVYDGMVAPFVQFAFRPPVGATKGDLVVWHVKTLGNTSFEGIVQVALAALLTGSALVAGFCTNLKVRLIFAGLGALALGGFIGGAIWSERYQKAWVRLEPHNVMQPEPEQPSISEQGRIQ